MVTWLAPLAIAAGLLSPSGDEAPSIRLAEDGSVEVVGLDRAALDQLERADVIPDGLLSLSVLGADVPMLGRVVVDENIVRFVPRFPLRPGTTYRATFGLASIPGGDPSAKPIEADLTLAAPADPDGPAKVVAVFPSSDEVPENLLRFYVHFATPMGRGEAYRRVSLLNSRGVPVAAPFLELDEELWDPSGTRLTLLIDPGRIKQGLVPRETFGPVLEAGGRYTLRVDPDWPDASGRPLASPFTKTFSAGPADESPPDPATWEVIPPSPGSTDPLVVHFPEPLDHALIGRLLHVADGEGRPVSGRITIDSDETRWQFTPEAPWRAGAYRLVAGTDLEDLVGNGIGRPFEVDLFDRVEGRVEANEVSLPFRVGR